jgi:hypothetical protein
VYSAVVLASLPTAQTALVFATQFGRGLSVARDSTLLTSLLGLVPVTIVTLLLGP